MPISSFLKTSGLASFSGLFGVEIAEIAHSGPSPRSRLGQPPRNGAAGPDWLGPRTEPRNWPGSAAESAVTWGFPMNSLHPVKQFGSRTSSNGCSEARDAYPLAASSTVLECWILTGITSIEQFAQETIMCSRE